MRRGFISVFLISTPRDVRLEVRREGRHGGSRRRTAPEVHGGRHAERKRGRPEAAVGGERRQKRRRPRRGQAGGITNIRPPREGGGAHDGNRGINRLIVSGRACGCRPLTKVT